MATSEDSDATVASEGNLSEGEHDEGSCSPSVLRPGPMAGGGAPPMEEVPCSSEDEMSEEYPPPNTSWPASTKHLTPTNALPGLKHVHSCRPLQDQRTDCSSAEERGEKASGSRPMKVAAEKASTTGNVSLSAMTSVQGTVRGLAKEVGTGKLAPDDAPSSMLSLEEVSRLQSALMMELEGLQTMQEPRPPGAAIDTNNLRRLQGKAAEVEGHLKAVSLANQGERKRLAAAHTALSSGASHEGTNQAIKDQLLDLASRQKQLLQLFVHQKTVAGKLSDLQREHSAFQCTIVPKLRTATSASDPAPSLSAPQSGTQTDTTQPLPMETQPTRQVLQQELNLTVPSTTSLPVLPLSSHCCPEPQPARLPADLAQPVPLAVLIQHQFIVPEVGSLSCTLMGCAFRATLLSDGCLEESGRKFPQPQHWLTACWAALGHQKKVVKRKQAYKMVLYKDVPLLQYCQNYSLKQVSSYLHQKQDRVEGGQTRKKEPARSGTLTHQDSNSNQTQAAMSTPAVDILPLCRPTEAFPVSTPTALPRHQCSWSVTDPRKSQSYLISDILTRGRVLLICKPAGAKLPEGFWEEDGDMWSPEVMYELYSDLDW